MTQDIVASSRQRLLVRTLLVALAYYAGARAGLALPYFGSTVTLLWPPTGIALAALLRWGPAMGPAILASAWLVTFHTSHSPLISSLISVGNTLGPLLGYFLLKGPAGFHTAMDRERDVWAFLLAGVTLPMLIPPTVGVATLVLTGRVQMAIAPSVWLAWWLGDAVGVMIAAPPLLTATPDTIEELLRARRSKRVLGLGALVLGLAAAVFLTGDSHPQVRAPLAYLSMVLLVWTALQWGMLGGSTLVLLVAGVAGVGTALGHGPFALPDSYLGLSLLWAFLATTSLACLLTLALSVGRSGAEASLRESERRLSLAIANLPGLIYRCRNEPEWPMEFMSEKVRAISGYTPEEILSGQPLYRDLIASEDRARVWEEVQVALSKSRPFKLEYRIRTKAGATRYCLEYGDAQRDAQGKILALEGIVFDNTERKQIEHALQDAQKLESIGRLAGGIAHDFNNLLVVITGYTELIRARTVASDVRRAHADQVLTAAARASDLTRQLLAYGRRQLLQPKVVGLSLVVADMNRLLARLIGENIEVRQQLDAHGLVYADPGQLEQVVMNLVLNASDAMPKGGVLTLRTEDLDVSSGDTHDRGLPIGAYVVLTVSDTGLGMSAEVQAHVFEPFFTTKEVGKGTGLGLSTVHGIVHQSGGNLTLESTPGRGTTFRVCLPRVEGSTQPTSVAQPTPNAPQRQGTILLIEDDAPVRTLMAEVLVQEGYDVLVAQNGEQALALSSAHPAAIDLVVSDVIMPGASGPRVLQALRDTRPGILALLISGYAREALSGDSLDDDNVVFMQKPFKPEDLLGQVATLLAVRTARL